MSLNRSGLFAHSAWMCPAVWNSHCVKRAEKKWRRSFKPLGVAMKRAMPDRRGYFGEFGGRFVPETLARALDELTAAYDGVRCDSSFWREFDSCLRHFAGRPTPIYHAARLTAHAGGAQIYIKREDLTHTGAHKINNAIGQSLLALRTGKHLVIAETGAGQHGVATATACARLGLECRVFMGAK